MAESNSNHLVAEIRENFGKGWARRIRAVGKIPAVIYGHGTDPVHVTLPGHETSLILRKSNQVLELDINGTEQLALVKDVQKDPVRQIIEHIDLIVVKKGEKVTVDVQVHLTGEPVSGTIAMQDAQTISVEVEAIHIPESVEVSIEGLEEGAHVTAADIVLRMPMGTITFAPNLGSSRFVTSCAVAMSAMIMGRYARPVCIGEKFSTVCR